MFIYDLHSRKSSEFHAIQCLYMLYIRGSPQSFMQCNVYIWFTLEEVLRVLRNTMFIYDVYARKSSEFYTIECLYMFYIRGSPQSFMQYNVYIWFTFEGVLRVLCNTMFIYDVYARKSSEFYTIECLYMFYIRGSPQSFMQYNVYIWFTFEGVLRVLCNTMFIYDVYARKSSEFYTIQCLYMFYIRGSPQSFMQYNVYIWFTFEGVLRVLCNTMFIYDLHWRKSSEFHAVQCLYMIYTRGSPQSFMQYNVYIWCIFEEVLRVLCNTMFIYVLHSRKSSEFYAIQCLYMIYIRGSPQSFMQYNVYIWFTLEEVRRVLCNAMFIYDLHSKKSSEFYAIQCLYMIYTQGSPQSFVQCNVYMIYIRGSPQSFMQYNVYMIYIRGSPQSFMQYNVYIWFTFEGVLRVLCNTMLYMIYTRGSPQSFMQYNVYIWFTFEEVLRVLCNAMFIYDLHSRKSSEFYAMQCLYMIYIRGSPQSFMQYNVYMIYIRGSPQSFMQYNVYIWRIFEEVLRVLCNTMLYMIYTRGSPQSFMQYNVYIWFTFEEVLRVLCNAMFIYDLHSRKSSEFHAMQCLYMIHIRGNPRSFMQYNVYIWITFEEVLRVSCNAMFIYDLHSRKSSEFYEMQCLYMNYTRGGPQSLMKCNVYIWFRFEEVLRVFMQCNDYM